MAVIVAVCSPSICAADVAWGLNPSLNDTIFVGFGALYATKASGSAQISERWRVEASYFWLSRSGSKSLDHDITVGNVVFPADTQVNSKLNFSNLRTSVGYSFYKTTDKELGVGLGLHVLQYQTSLSTQTQGTEGRTVLAPLPVLSIYGGFALDEQWSVGARLDEFSLTYGQHGGGITVLGLNLHYQPFRHVGFGVGYTALYFKFSSTATGQNSFQGTLTQNLQGPSFYLTASF
jgi:hypothetical protein